MDADKSKKLLQYAAILQEQAKDAETNGRNEDAIKIYLKLVDVFLLLGSETSDHNTWSQYIRQAEAYQSRIRSLVPQEQQQQANSRMISPGERVSLSLSQPQLQSQSQSSQLQAKRPQDFLPNATTTTNSAAPNNTSQDSSQSTKSGSGGGSAFSKILKPFQQKGEGNPGSPSSSLSSSSSSPSSSSKPSPSLSSSPQGQSGSSILSNSAGSSIPTFRQPLSSAAQGLFPAAAPPLPAPPSSSSSKPLPEERAPVPHELYERILTENKILQEKLAVITRERDEKVLQLESRNRELEERIAMMVTRQDYDLLRAEFDRMVPRVEYDRVRDELSNSIPISHYNLLIDRISNMVPREIYLSSERRALELEAKLQQSIPANVIEDIANEVSLLNVVAEVPPNMGEMATKGKKQQQQEEEEEKEEKEEREKEGLDLEEKLRRVLSDSPREFPNGDNVEKEEEQQQRIATRAKGKTTTGGA